MQKRLTEISNPLRTTSEYQEMNKALFEKRGPVHASSVTDGAKAFLISQLVKDEKKWKLVISYDDTKARELYNDIRSFSENVLLYPAKDFLFYSADIRGNLISGQRIDVWRHILSDERGVVITTIDALMDKLEAPDRMRKKVIRIDKADKIIVDELIEKLVEFGYERLGQVDSPGQFAVRGGIIDIYPLTEDTAVRIELWDEDIDSMRSFDADSQRSIDEKDSVSIYPATEIELGGEASFLRYFDPDDTAIFVDEPIKVNEKARSVEKEFNESMAGRIASGQADPGEIPELFDAEETIKSIETGSTLYLTGLDTVTQDALIKRDYKINVRNASTYHNAFTMLIEDLKAYKAKGYKVLVLTASHTRVERLRDNFRDYDLEIDVQYGNLHQGFEFPDVKFVIISESDIFGMKTKRRRFKKRFDYDGERITSLSQLSVGDYVVHEDHGLGIYKGIEKIEKNHVIKDYIKIEYAGGDHCYLSATKLDIIQKYSDGGEDATRRPRLNKLNGKEWEATKVNVRKAVQNIAKELVTLYASRLDARGYAYGPDTVWQKEFEEMFEFEETDDQIKAIEAVKHDMENGKIMDRLVCGDVGYGKTEVALRAAFKVIQEGKQVIYLVPTTILAQQHFNTFTKRMENFPVRVELLSRFRTATQQKKIIENFKKGMVDVLIGTHRVLSKDIEPKDLGLVIIDEEQRFGVKHKEKLKELRKDVNVLTLTATPIPRTLHMSLSGIRDLSVLEEPPQDRQPIQTYVMEYSEETVKEAIRREIQRGGQVYYVYNRVNGIADLTARIQAMIPEASVAFAHGQMNEKELEEIMVEFINGNIDVLVSTTIIETGLDIPNVNTMIIHDSDQLGLAQLYQLRGRVGRSSRTAYAFLLYRRGKMLTDEAEKRLRSIKEFTELGSGIRIAMRDLEIRGAGNVLGAEQHGHMQAVGYDLYCKMLNTAVHALKGEDTTSAEFDTAVDADIDAFIPPEYIASEEQKLDIYKRIASIINDDDYMDMQDELIDRFGEIPKPVENLLLIAKIKSLAHDVYVTDVSITPQEVVLRLYRAAKIDPEKIPDFIRSYKGRLMIKPGFTTELNLIIREKQVACDEAIEQTVTLLKEMQQLKALPPEENAK